MHLEPDGRRLAVRERKLHDRRTFDRDCHAVQGGVGRNREGNDADPRLKVGGADLDLVEGDGLGAIEHVAYDDGAGSVDAVLDPGEVDAATAPLGAVDEGDMPAIGSQADDAFLVCEPGGVDALAFTFADEFVPEVAEEVERRVALFDGQRALMLVVGRRGKPPETTVCVGVDQLA